MSLPLVSRQERFFLFRVPAFGARGGGGGSGSPSVVSAPDRISSKKANDPQISIGKEMSSTSAMTPIISIIITVKITPWEKPMGESRRGCARLCAAAMRDRAGLRKDCQGYVIYDPTRSSGA